MACSTFVKERQPELCLPEMFPLPDYTNTHITEHYLEVAQMKMEKSAKLLKKISEENKILLTVVAGQ